MICDGEIRSKQEEGYDLSGSFFSGSVVVDIESFNSSRRSQIAALVFI